MNAVEFVKERGWDRSSEIVKECPTEMSFVGKCGFSKASYKGFVCNSELKNLVDAWWLVQKFGGLFQARVTLDKEGFTGGIELDGELIEDDVLKQAIKLVEQCNES